MKTLRSVIFLVIFCGLTLADHLPQSLMARGKPETVLCGIDVYKTTLAALKERFGEPKSFEQYPKTEEAAEIIWEKDGSIIQATINVDNVAYAVQLSGKRTPFAQTGNGLALGQTLGDVKRIYGRRFFQKGNTVTLQWENGTQMRVKLLGGKIVSLFLMANVE